MSTDPLADLDYSKYGFSDPENYVHRIPVGLTEATVREISEIKNEPEWMLQNRLKAYKIFLKAKMPSWGGVEKLKDINFDNITYYIKPSETKAKTWDDVPDTIKETFERLGIPEAERKYFAGVGAQYESEVVYHKLRKDLEEKGVVFIDTDTAVKEYPEIVKKWFGKVVPAQDNKFAALNTAVWSGGSFVYIPKGVEVDSPLQAYFRINAKNMGQFERTLIIAEPGSRIHYIEGCTAPVYSSHSLHTAVVEVIGLRDSYIRYTTVQNWSRDIFNLVTKRAHAYAGATIEWVDGNLGSYLTMKYPSVYLLEPGAKAEIMSIAYAGEGMHQDAGAKVLHLAKDTTSRIISKSISKSGGRSTYRGLLKVAKGATGVKSSVQCDALLLDDESRTDTYPYMEIDEQDATISHEATVGKIGEEELFYLQTRGIPESEALNLLVMGFLEPFTKQLPIDYAVELNRLIAMEMEGSIG
ncbi:MAG: FeS cluster assembly protein SufB [Candidatus Heimdallarchaeota archaeon LC_3]|nr:MAG: FeS cluster assembly protein SufB [Candidatus Heimdallarchaeota archaeon LC_3]